MMFANQSQCETTSLLLLTTVHLRSSDPQPPAYVGWYFYDGNQKGFWNLNSTSDYVTL